MENAELQRQMARLEKDNAELTKKRLTTQKETNQAYADLFELNETLKLYDKTNDDLELAIRAERGYLEVVMKQVDQLRELLHEEIHHKN